MDKVKKHRNVKSIGKNINFKYSYRKSVKRKSVRLDGGKEEDDDKLILACNNGDKKI